MNSTSLDDLERENDSYFKVEEKLNDNKVHDSYATDIFVKTETSVISLKHQSLDNSSSSLDVVDIKHVLRYSQRNIEDQAEDNVLALVKMDQIDPKGMDLQTLHNFDKMAD